MDPQSTPPPNPIDHVRDLDRLAREINEHYEVARARADETKELGNESVREAILCGAKLNQAKVSVGHGKFLKWIARHCPEISRHTAVRWMRLANVAHVQHLEDAAGLRQAYQICGILPESERSEGGEAKPFTVETLLRTVSSITRRVEQVLTLPRADQQRLVEQLKPVVDLYRSLAGEQA